MSKTFTIITRDGRRIEALTDAQIRELLFRRRIHPEDWVATTGSDECRQLSSTDEFSAVSTTARRKCRKAKEADPDMDMTPMIDVVFLLLIFFMITATFHLQTGMKFPPEKQEEQKQQQTQAPGLGEIDDRVIVEINELDQFHLKTGGTSNPVEVEKLAEAIRAESEKSNLKKVFVVAHEMASLEAIVKAFDSAAEVGIGDIALADITSTRIAPRGTGSNRNP